MASPRATTPEIAYGRITSHRQRGFVVSSPERSSDPARAYFFLPVACFAVMACCFFCWAPVALVCFCDACLPIDFGDLSPISFVFFLTVSIGLLTCGLTGCSEGNLTMPHYARLCKSAWDLGPTPDLRVCA